MEKFTIGEILLIIVFVIIGVAFKGAIIMFLWNWLAVALFGMQTISFWVSCAIAFILTIISSFFKTTGDK